MTTYCKTCDASTMQNMEGKEYECEDCWKLNTSQTVHHLWWLYKFMSRNFKGKEYKDIIRKPVDTDTRKELQELIQYITNA